MKKDKTQLKNKTKENLTAELNNFAVQNMENQTEIAQTSDPNAEAQISDHPAEKPLSGESIPLVSQNVSDLFDRWDSEVAIPQYIKEEVPVDSLESRVGYSSLLRQMHQGFIKRVTFYRSEKGGSATLEEARAAAFHQAKDKDEIKELFEYLLRVPLECLNFADLNRFQTSAPRVAEKFWEYVKKEGRKEFLSGHLSANISFPADYMKEVWNIARYLGVRESFISEWKPRGGIEISMIDMLTQAYFQWQYWLEQTVKRSQTPERQEHPEYSKWKHHLEETIDAKSWEAGYWLRPYVSEQQAIEHAVQSADKWNRIYMRTLRQLRDLRRYSPVTINNPQQVNIAANGGQQVNVSKADEEKSEKVIS
jgi:hypothetical protein